MIWKTSFIVFQEYLSRGGYFYPLVIIFSAFDETFNFLLQLIELLLLSWEQYKKLKATKLVTFDPDI